MENVMLRKFNKSDKKNVSIWIKSKKYIAKELVKKICSIDNEKIENCLVLEYNAKIMAIISFNVFDIHVEMQYFISPYYSLRHCDFIIVKGFIEFLKQKYEFAKKLNVINDFQNVSKKKRLLDIGFHDNKGSLECDIDFFDIQMRKSPMNSKKILFVTNNENTLELYDWLKEKFDVCIYSDIFGVEELKLINPDIIISYNYNYIIKKDIIDYMEEHIINMHISYLPYNRGFSPNIWSFIDDTPKGVTIHKLSEGLDEGDIIIQKKIIFDEKSETLRTTYDTLNREIVSLLKDNIDMIMKGDYKASPQMGIGTKHTQKQLIELQEKVSFKWDDKVEDFLNRYHTVFR